jgi:hypothetical protein
VADDLSNPSPFFSCNEIEMAATSASVKCIQVLMELSFGCIGPNPFKGNMFQEERHMPMKKKAKKKKH